MNNKNANLRNLAMNSLKEKVVKERANGTTIVAVEELKINGSENSKVITLNLSNASAVNNYNVVFGTPLGIGTEYQNIPFYTSITNIMFTGLADLSDQQGVGINYLQQLNKRFVRKPVYISHIEIITPATSKGSDQRSVSPRKFVIPYNSYEDSTAIAGAYVPQWTEYTSINILEKGYVVGEFNGFSYEILTQSSVKMNIHLAAIDTPTFMYGRG